MGDVWRGVIEDFSDLPDTGRFPRLTTRVLLAAILSNVLGFERLMSGKEAGPRTHMLVSLGTALFVLIPTQAGMMIANLIRVIQGIVAGIGFIGAGAILKQTEQEEIKGLATAAGHWLTAAGLWLTAAVGMAVGIGHQSSAIVGTLLALFILAALQRGAHWLGGAKPPGFKNATGG